VLSAADGVRSLSGRAPDPLSQSSALVTHYCHLMVLSAPPDLLPSHVALAIDAPSGNGLFSRGKNLAMKIIRTEKQRENLAKYFWDMSKVAFAVLVVGPFANP